METKTLYTSASLGATLSEKHRVSHPRVFSPVTVRVPGLLLPQAMTKCCCHDDMMVMAG